ncbi:MAG TPA: cysteine--tRNA ligase [Candidatus Limnocylindrales bacterium]|nr:cysteine--tRNA ligase [Candidatus Limnocylindrales bacterium]
MALRFRNTLSGELETFEPLERGRVGLYTCGPTVYAPAHVGNFRSFVFADVLRRYLGWAGYRVTWVMNITDVDDKIIRAAAEQGVATGELTDRYTERFLDDMRRLRITRPDVLPRATEHIPDMAALTVTLIDRGHAYRTQDGSVFFSIASWPAYGRLARLDPSMQRVGERVEADEYAKDDVRDFAVWKGPKPGEPSWSTPIGEGRPGWHIECSAMSMRYLGASFDLHTGGVDLIFPHHEDEIAQSEAATGKPFVTTWLHCAHLRMGGEKMAKRTGNFARPEDVYERGYPPRVLRYALLAAHYRAPLEFSDASLTTAASAVERLSTCLAALDTYREDRGDDATLPDLLASARMGFVEAMDDDLNVAPALAATFDLVRELNRRMSERAISTADAARAAEQLRDVDRVLAIAEEDRDAASSGGTAGGDQIEALLAERAAARAAKDWSRSDALRARLAELGIIVEDTADGQRSRRVTEVARG